MLLVVLGFGLGCSEFIVIGIEADIARLMRLLSSPRTSNCFSWRAC